MTLVRVTFKNEPTAVEVTKDRWESLWMKDCRLEDISGPAIVIGEEDKARSRYNLEGVVCRTCRCWRRYPSGKKVGGAGADLRGQGVLVRPPVQGRDRQAGDRRRRARWRPLAALPPAGASDIARAAATRPRGST